MFDGKFFVTKQKYSYLEKDFRIYKRYIKKYLFFAEYMLY